MKSILLIGLLWSGIASASNCPSNTGNLNWNPLVDVDLIASVIRFRKPTFICSGTDSAGRLQGLSLRVGSTFYTFSINEFRSPKVVLHQSQLPAAAQRFVRKAPLIALQYVGSELRVRFLRNLRGSDANDFREMIVNVVRGRSGRLYTQYQGSIVSKLEFYAKGFRFKVKDIDVKANQETIERVKSENLTRFSRIDS